MKSIILILLWPCIFVLIFAAAGFYIDKKIQKPPVVSENRIEKFGWMDKGRELNFIKLIDGTIGIEGVFPLKENISEGEDTWPPKKVRITVEEVKE